LKVSISTHLFVFQPLDDAILSLLPLYGFAFAEIWAMPPHFPYEDDAAADRIAGDMARHGVRIASIHGPIYPDVRTYKTDRWFSLASLDAERRAASVEANRKAAAWLGRNGGGTVVLHTGFPSEDWYPHRWAAFLSSLNELIDSSPPSVRFAVENTPVGSGRTDVIMDIVARYPAERVGVCLDLGHANIQESVPAAIKAVGGRLIHVHASDNNGEKDDHFIPGKGKIRWDRAIAALRETGFEGPFTQELRDYTRGENAPYKDIGQILAEARSALNRILGNGA
jgi:sugar phosphate isomerase/epimerase